MFEVQVFAKGRDYSVLYESWTSAVEYVQMIMGQDAAYGAIVMHNGEEVYSDYRG